METTLNILERDRNSKAIIVHIVVVSDACPLGGWYRQITCYESFYGRALKRWSRSPQKKINYRLRFGGHGAYSDFLTHKKIHNKIWTERLAPIEDPEKVHYSSLWKFFDCIGWDYKNKSVKQIDNILMVGK